MTGSTSAYDPNRQPSKSENRGESVDITEGFEELFNDAEAGSGDPRLQGHIGTIRVEPASGHSVFDAIEEFQQEHQQQLRKQEKGLEDLQQRLINQENEQSNISTQLQSVGRTVEELNSDMSAMEQELSTVRSDLEETVTSDNARDIADEKINDRVVRPIFFLISLLTLAVGSISFVTGPVIVGVALISVTIVAWYLLYISR